MRRIILYSRCRVLGLVVMALTACGDGEHVPSYSHRVPDGQTILVNGEHSFVPDNGYVPDEKTATGIAEAVLSAVSESANIDPELPLTAQLNGRFWSVSGTVSTLGSSSILLEIAKADGRIVSTVFSGDYVPDAQTAARIAEAVLIPVYGRSQIEEQRPFQAELLGDVWRVLGTLPASMVGGTGTIDVARTDARVLRLSHGL